MYQNQQSTTGSNRTMVPEAKQALNNMKFEIANELGINLKDVYKRQVLTSPARRRLPRSCSKYCLGTPPIVEMLCNGSGPSPAWAAR